MQQTINFINDDDVKDNYRYSLAIIKYSNLHKEQYFLINYNTQ